MSAKSQNVTEPILCRDADSAVPCLFTLHQTMGGQITRNAFYDSLGGPFPTTSHRCHHKPKRCLPIQQCGSMAPFPLLFHPSAKGSQIVMDMSQRTVKRQASFCNAITFGNRPIALYEQVRLKITKKQCCWSGALRLGFTSKDPSRINPDNLPKYACPDLVSQSGFWAKALPEELSNEGNIISFWVDKKGRVFYRINESSPMLFFSGVHASEPLWALIDVYGLTRGVQLLDSEMVPLDCLRPRSFTTAHRASIRRDGDDSRLSISLCDLSLQQHQDLQEEDADNEEVERLRPPSSSSFSCHVPQNSQNSQQCSLLPALSDSDLRFHSVRGVHITALDEQTVARLEPRGEERTLVFTSRPLRCSETVFVKVSKAGAARVGSLSYGVTSCDPAVLRPSDLPYNPDSLVDRKEFWAVCRVAAALQSGDILGFVVSVDGEVTMSHNGVSAGMQLCVDNSRPLWMFYGLHGNITQLRILGSSLHPDIRGPSVPSSPSCTPNASNSEANLDTHLNMNLNTSYQMTYSCSTGTTPGSPFSSHLESPSFPSCSGSWSDECTICYENAVDTVLYACGHMCLCYECGLKLKKMTNACCPICRRTIKDIIKTYRST